MFNWLIGKKKSSEPEAKKETGALCPLEADGRAVTKDPGSSCFFLGVWNCDTAVSDGEAARQYVSLSEGRDTTAGFNDEVYAFYSQLIRCYPEIDMVPENELDTCPWACDIDSSGTHVIMAIRPNQSAQVFAVVMALAEQHGLLCFDPQAGKVYLPSRFGSQARRAGS